MYDYMTFLYSSNIGFIIGSSSLGAGLGTGIASLSTIKALNKAPSSHAEITKAAIIGLALIETGAIIALVMGLLLLFNPPAQTLATGIGAWGIGIALGISGLVIGIVSAFPAQQAVEAIARQPFFSANIINVMLLTQSIIQTPVIFAFLISLLIKVQLGSVETIANGVRLLASGICIGLGTIGPAIGLAHFAHSACKSIGINRYAYSSILPFTFISQAIIETPIVFSLLISLIILSNPLTINDDVSSTVAIFAAALCIGLGTLGPGISSGKTAASACREIANNPENYSTLSKTSTLGQTLIDSSAGYALLVSLLILLFKS